MVVGVQKVDKTIDHVSLFVLLVAAIENSSLTTVSTRISFWRTERYCMIHAWERRMRLLSMKTINDLLVYCISNYFAKQTLGGNT